MSNSTGKSAHGVCTVVSLLILLLFGCDNEQPRQEPGTQPKTGAESVTHPPTDTAKVLFVNSYHKGYEWSDAIGTAIFSYFRIPVDTLIEKGEAVGDVQMRIIYMDSKRQKSEAYLLNKGKEIKKLIDIWQPDVVITADDNAAKYLLAPFFINHSLPFVFCGVNWDANEYGLPAANVTGMLEVQLIDEILAYLKPLATGNRIGFLKGDDMSARREASFYEERFGLHLDKRFVQDFSAWQRQYQSLQDEVDLLLIGNAASVTGWDGEKARQLVTDTTRVPSGNWDLWMAPYALMTIATKPEEQGQWAARTAAEILGGKSPAAIETVKNVTAHVVLNMKLAGNMNIKLPMSLVEHASFVDEEP
jgi:ABC-type uncharacterized transport system substrate-binding protein